MRVYEDFLSCEPLEREREDQAIQAVQTCDQSERDSVEYVHFGASAAFVFVLTYGRNVDVEADVALKHGGPGRAATVFHLKRHGTGDAVVQIRYLFVTKRQSERKAR